MMCNALPETATEDKMPQEAQVLVAGEEIRELAASLPPCSIVETICIEGFGWDSHRGHDWYKRLEGMVPDLAALGVTHVWLPPPSTSVAPQGYLPGQLYRLDSAYGTADELYSLNRALLKAGLRPMADIVINHRCADGQDEHGIWNHFGDDVPHPGRRIDWGPWAIAGSDPDFRGTGGRDTGDDYGAAPDLDHDNVEVREGIVDWMKWLHEAQGFQGWRFDFVRGYAAKFSKEYIERTVGKDAFCVGENFVDLRWSDSNLELKQDSARRLLTDWIDAAGDSCSLFDFPLKGQLNEAAKRTQFNRLRDDRGKPNGLLGWWPERSVTFIDNHDTGSSQQHWPMPSDSVELGYAYILTHPGVPCLFIEHYMDGKLKPKLETLVALRKKAGLRANSKVEILAAEPDMYVARITGTTGAVTLKLGPRYDMGNLVPNKGEGWELAASGHNYAAWAKST